MARTYAGILGPLALLTSLARGLIHATETDSVLLTAWCSLLVFAGVGCVMGWIAGHIVRESVGATIKAELAREGTKENLETAAPGA